MQFLKLIHNGMMKFHFNLDLFSFFPLQVFVETLDKCFENVCELDLIFHVDKVLW